jgi:hypothetical protein
MSQEKESGKKRSGPASGTKYNSIKKTLNEWYNVCKAYDELTTKVTMTQFLESKDSGPNFSGTHSEKVSFSKKYKEYKEGKLQPSDGKRKKPSSFPEVEKKLIAYIELRARFYKRDKCGLSWSLLMSMLKVKVTETSLDCVHTAYALQGSFVAEQEQFTEEDYNCMIENWICVEDELEVINAVCEDEIEELERNTNLAANHNVEDDDEPDPQPMEIDSDESNLFSYVEAVEVLGRLQKSAPKLGISEASTVHIDRLLRALHSGNAKKARKDTTLHAFWSTK